MFRFYTMLWPAFVILAGAACLEAAKEPLKIHMISGSKEYKSEPSLKAFKKELEKTHNVTITASWVQDKAKNLPGIENVPKADLLIVFARRLKLPEKQMNVLRKHWESGKPVVGLRTASHAFGKKDNQTFDRKVLGGNYTGHFGDEPVKVQTAEGAKDHPVLKGVGKIVSRKLYKAGPLAAGAKLLQKGTSQSGGHTHAVTWVNEYKGGRMFYTSLGVPKDFENPAFRKMIVNAIYWTTKTKPAAEKATK